MSFLYLDGLKFKQSSWEVGYYEDEAEKICIRRNGSEIEDYSKVVNAYISDVFYPMIRDKI